MMTCLFECSNEIKEGRRFSFGRNWNGFLENAGKRQIKWAEKYLIDNLDLGTRKLWDKRFVDIGCGSGIFSLAAVNLSAIVRSFDYDELSAGCTSTLKSIYCPDNEKWSIDCASVLDEDYLKKIGKFDVVFSWGALHHTGDMWKALDNASKLVNEKGLLFVAIYNKCKFASPLWLKIKKLYCSGLIWKILICLVLIPFYFIKYCAESLYHRRNVFNDYKDARGMSNVTQWLDWIGGYPYEYASVEEVFDFLSERDFTLRKIKTTNSTSTNEFLFQKS